MAMKSGTSFEDNEFVLSVVTSVYNEQETISELVSRVLASCRSLAVPFEFLVINDGSHDGTLPRLIELSRDNGELRIVNLFRNFGQMPALSAGIALARGQAVVLLDGDLQDPPELIPRLVAEWHSGADVVSALRTCRGESAGKRGAIALFYWLLEKMTDTPIPKQVGTFGLMDRRIVDVLNSMPERHRYLPGLRAWVGGKQTFVPYERPDRKDGKSRVAFGGLFRLARTAFLSFSKVPLRLASTVSLMFGLVVFLVGISAILTRLFTNLAIPGWATYTTLLGMIGFFHSFMLTVISEYIAVIFDEIKARPFFLVREEFACGSRVERAPPGTSTKRRPDEPGPSR